MVFEQEIRTLRGTAAGLDNKARQRNLAPGADVESKVVLLTEREAELLARTLEVIAGRLDGLMNPNVERAFKAHGFTLATIRMGSDPRGETFRIDEPSLPEVKSYTERDWGKTVS